MRPRRRIWTSSLGRSCVAAALKNPAIPKAISDIVMRDGARRDRAVSARADLLEDLLAARTTAPARRTPAAARDARAREEGQGIQSRLRSRSPGRTLLLAVPQAAARAPIDALSAARRNRAPAVHSSHVLKSLFAHVGTTTAERMN